MVAENYCKKSNFTMHTQYNAFINTYTVPPRVHLILVMGHRALCYLAKCLLHSHV